MSSFSFVGWLFPDEVVAVQLSVVKEKCQREYLRWEQGKIMTKRGVSPMEDETNRSQRQRIVELQLIWWSPVVSGSMEAEHSVVLFRPNENLSSAVRE